MREAMNPTNICSSGSVVQANSRNGFAILTGADLKPGSGRRAEITIANLGTLPAGSTVRGKGIE